jgi:drug/metabolite transporter (DMT)-like permease
VVGLSGLNPLNFQNLPSGGAAIEHWQNWLSWILSGLLVSGGSAFWNHALDIVQAAKVQKEQAVNAALPAGQKIPA